MAFEGALLSVITVKNLSIGEGLPKIIVPLMGKTVHDLVGDAQEAISAGADCLEWRADFFEGVANNCSTEALGVATRQIEDAAASLREAAPDAPLLFTLRTASQGGNVNLSTSNYVELVQSAIESRAFNLVDIELNQGDLPVKKLVRCAAEHECVSLVSYHNFNETPSIEWMASTLVRMHDLGADVPKLAVMAKSKQDSLRLLAATDEVAHTRNIGPLLTMAMSENGALTRLLGEAYGSAMTFASVKETSAPGQMSIEQTRAALNALHEALS